MISCHIATIPERENSLRQVLAAIVPQVGKTYVSLNGYQVKPDWFHTIRNVECELLDNSLADSAKFLHVNDEPAICFFLDDDLIVSPNYVRYMLNGLNKYGGAVSLHGRKYVKPVKSFRRNFTANYRCLGNVANDERVQLLGTGCMAFDNRQVKLDSSVYEHRLMADVLFSRFCTYNNIPMTVLSHKAGQYLKYIPPADGKTIWRSTTEDSIQTKIMNSFLK